MRRATINEYEKLADKLSNNVGVMNYRFMDLCVKAEPVSLLPVEVLIEGETKKIEECANISKEGDFQFEVFPNYEEDLNAIMKSVMRFHPEFKQEIKTTRVSISDENGQDKGYDIRYLLLTMPEVNDDRYDVLKEGVKVIYNECKVQMELANNKSKVKFAELAMGETKENLELLDKELDKLNNQWNTQRDNLYNAKLQEIEDAHNKWLAEQDELERKRQEDEAAHSETAATSMRMDRTDIN